MSNQYETRPMSRADAEREAWLLGQNPYVKETIERSQEALRATFPSLEDKIDLSKVSFISGQRRINMLIEEMSRTDLIYDMLHRNSVQVNSVQIPRYAVKERASGVADVHLVAHIFADIFNKPLDEAGPVNYSVGAIDIFQALAGAAFNVSRQRVPLDVNPDKLKELGFIAVDKISQKAKTPEVPAVRRIIDRVRDEVDRGDRLSMRANGGSAELLLNGKMIDVLFSNENALLQYLAVENAEEVFKKLMAESEVDGKRWFLQPEEWPQSETNYKYYKDHEKHDEVLAMVTQSGMSAEQLLLESQMASILLDKRGIPHTRLGNAPAEETIEPKKSKQKDKKKSNTKKNTAPKQVFKKSPKSEKMVIVDQAPIVSAPPTAPIRYEGPAEVMFETKEAARIRRKNQKKDRKIAAEKERQRRAEDAQRRIDVEEERLRKRDQIFSRNSLAHVLIQANIPTEIRRQTRKTPEEEQAELELVRKQVMEEQLARGAENARLAEEARIKEQERLAAIAEEEALKKQAEDEQAKLIEKQREEDEAKYSTSNRKKPKSRAKTKSIDLDDLPSDLPIDIQDDQFTPGFQRIIKKSDRR